MYWVNDNRWFLRFFEKLVIFYISEEGRLVKIELEYKESLVWGDGFG